MRILCVVNVSKALSSASMAKCVSACTFDCLPDGRRASSPFFFVSSVYLGMIQMIHIYTRHSYTRHMIHTYTRHMTHIVHTYVYIHPAHRTVPPTNDRRGLDLSFFPSFSLSLSIFLSLSLSFHLSLSLFLSIFLSLPLHLVHLHIQANRRNGEARSAEG